MTGKPDPDSTVTLVAIHTRSSGLAAGLITSDQDAEFVAHVAQKSGTTWLKPFRTFDEAKAYCLEISPRQIHFVELIFPVGAQALQNAVFEHSQPGAVRH